MEPWRAAALELAEAAGLDGSWGEVLRAFDGPPGDTARLPERIEAALADEVDADQAALFARRFRQLAGLLGGLERAEARILEVFLAERAGGILAAAPPRALRIRALVDYVFGRVSVVVHHDPAAPPAAELVRRAALAPVAPGVAHATVAGVSRDGPVHVNLLRLRDVALSAVDARPGCDLVALAAARGAIAGFSGGFFLYSEPDIAPPAVRGDPVGLLVGDGEVLGAPSLRRTALIQRQDGSVDIDVIGPCAASWRLGGASVRPLSCNAPSREGPSVYNRAFGPRAPEGGGPAVAIEAGRVVAVGSGGLPIPLNGVVIALGAPIPELRVGDEVRVALAGVRTAIAGGPRLLGPGARDLPAEDFAGTAPPVTFSRDETFDTNLLPRLAAGLAADGTLWVVAVDGRDLDRAPGMTLRGTAALLDALSCERACNLDGGSSKRMVVAGRTVDLSSTELHGGSQGATERVRPVRTAVLVAPVRDRVGADQGTSRRKGELRSKPTRS